MSSKTPATKVKICGIAQMEDALEAARAGADFLGFILYPKSARNMEPAAVREIVAEVRRQFSDVRTVAVMVDETADAAERLVRETGVDFAQLHGRESVELVAELRRRGVSVIKALKFGNGAAGAADFQSFEPDFYLGDTFDASAAGGTGRAFDHALLPEALPREKLFLAGGLTPETVAAAVRAVRPFAVDVASGVEAEPRRKDLARVRAFIEQVRAANRAAANTAGEDR